MFAKFDKIPSLPVQDIKEKPKTSQTERRTVDVKTVYPKTTKLRTVRSNGLEKYSFVEFLCSNSRIFLTFENKLYETNSSLQLQFQGFWWYRLISRQHAKTWIRQLAYCYTNRNLTCALTAPSRWQLVNDSVETAVSYKHWTATWQNQENDCEHSEDSDQADLSLRCAIIG